MKALTIWQPYASLLAGGIKRYETRSWATGYRGAVAVHAAKKPPVDTIMELSNSMYDGKGRKIPGIAQEVERTLEALDRLYPGPRDLEKLPTGAVIGLGQLVGCHYIDEEFLDKLDGEERALGDFSPGRFAWEFKPNMYIFATPIPAKGMQGLWEWDGRKEL